MQYGHWEQAKEAPYLDVNAPAQAVITIIIVEVYIRFFSNPFIKKLGFLKSSESKKIFITIKNRKKALAKCNATDQGIFDFITVKPPNKPWIPSKAIK